jgi:hypothetical protein
MTDLRNLSWRKSTYSDSSGGACVEVAPLAGGQVAVRHSRRPDGAVIVWSPDEWAAFTAGIRAGEFDIA